MATAALTVDLNARIAQFETEMKRATGTLDRFGKSSTALGTLLKGTFAAVGVAGLAAFAKSGIDAADSLNDMSTRLGVTVKDLASLQLVADQSGSSLEGIGTRIAKLNKSFSEAQGGNDKLSKSLLSLGVTASTPLERFYQLADAVAAMDDPTKRAADLSAVLGKGYLDIIPTLVQGGAALRESAKASESFADAMARLAPNADKFNDQLASLKMNAAGAAASILANLVPSLSEYLGALNEVLATGSLLDKLKFFTVGYVNADVADKVTDYTTRTAQLREELVRLQKDVKDTTEVVARLNKLYASKVTSIQAPPKHQGASASNGAQLECIAKGGTWDGTSCTPKKTTSGSKSDPQGAFVDKLKQEASTLGMGSEALQRYEANKLKLTGTNKKLADSYITQIAAFKDQQEAAKANNDAFDEAIKKQDELDSVLEGSIKSLREWIAEQTFEASLIGMSNADRETAIQLRAAEAAGIDTQVESFKKLKEQITAISETKQVDAMVGNTDFSKLKKDQEDMILLTKAFTDGIVQADGSLRKLSESDYLETVKTRLGLVGEKMNEMDTFATEAAKNIQNSMANFLFDPFNDGLKGMAQGFGDMLKHMIANAVAADLAKKLFGGLADNGATSGSGLAGAALNWVGGLFASANGNAFANGAGLSAYSGSIVSSPTVFPFAKGMGLMGEAGPEAILPLKRGANGKLGIAGGGGGHTIVVNISGSNNAPDVRRAAGQGAREALGMIGAAKRYA